MSTQYIINNNDGLLSGQTINGDLTVTNSLSATTYYGDGSNLSGITITPSYKVYTALLTRTGAVAPTEIVLQNTIGTITFSYNSLGNYRADSAALFTAGKTAVFITQEINGTFGNVLAVAPISSSVIAISQTTSGGPNDDDWSWPVSIEIRVYN